MITDWETAINFVLEQEGGLTEDPKDPGGLTNFGISKKAYPNEDIRAMTKERAMEIYIKDYWKPCKCDELPRPFAIGLFDSAVNRGPVTAVKILQRSLGITDDGVVGPQTISAATAATPRMVKLYLAKRLADYANLMAKHNELLVFATNWSFRVLSLSEIIL